MRELPYRSTARRLRWPMLFFGGGAAFLGWRAWVERSIVAAVFAVLSLGFVVAGLLVAIEERGKHRAVLVGDETLTVPGTFRRPDVVIAWIDVRSVEERKAPEGRFLEVVHAGGTTWITASMIGEPALDELRALITQRLPPPAQKQP